jgi:hypothetical protein
MGGKQATGVLAQIQSEKKIREGKQVTFHNHSLIVRLFNHVCYNFFSCLKKKKKMLKNPIKQFENEGNLFHSSAR